MTITEAKERGITKVRRPHWDAGDHVDLKTMKYMNASGFNGISDTQNNDEVLYIQSAIATDWIRCFDETYWEKRCKELEKLIRDVNHRSWMKETEYVSDLVAKLKSIKASTAGY